MRYKIRTASGWIEIKSENAALSHQFQSKCLVDFLKSRALVSKSLDYGCGKLRYTNELRKISDTVMLADSEIQLTRVQEICGKRTSIRDFAKKNWNDVNVSNLNELADNSSKYDFILCCNVLSAIPRKNLVLKTLKILSSKLAKRAECLIVNQHSNSHFTKWKTEGIKWEYGWLYKGRRGYSYYGIINKIVLDEILPKAGFTKIQIWIEGQSTYSLCSK